MATRDNQQQQPRERKDSWTIHGMIDPSWKPTKLNQRMRTTSEDSTGTAEMSSPDSPTRRLSITERFFGSSIGGRRSSVESDVTKNQTGQEGGQMSQNEEFRNFMKRQRKILGEN